MANSLMQIVSDGSLSTIPLTIKFFEQSHIKVFVNNVELPDGAYTFAWSGTTTITITPAVALGAEVSIRRKTPANEVLHDFQAGAVFSEVSVDENFRQELFLLQEASEQSFVTDLYADLDMHGSKVRNIGAGVLPSDAVNLAQAIQIAEGGGTSTLRADLASANGTNLIGLPQGKLSDAIKYITPEMFWLAGDADDTNSWLRCIDHQTLNGLNIEAHGRYTVSGNLLFKQVANIPPVSRDYTRATVNINYMKFTGSGACITNGSSAVVINIGELEGVTPFTGPDQTIGIQLMGTHLPLHRIGYVHGFATNVKFQDAYGASVWLGECDDASRGVRGDNSNACRVFGSIGGRFSTAAIDPTTCLVGFEWTSTCAANEVFATVEYCRRDVGARAFIDAGVSNKYYGYSESCHTASSIEGNYSEYDIFNGGDNVRSAAGYYAGGIGNHIKLLKANALSGVPASPTNIGLTFKYLQPMQSTTPQSSVSGPGFAETLSVGKTTQLVKNSNEFTTALWDGSYAGGFAGASAAFGKYGAGETSRYIYGTQLTFAAAVANETQSYRIGQTLTGITFSGHISLGIALRCVSGDVDIFVKLQGITSGKVYSIEHRLTAGSKVIELWHSCPSASGSAENYVFEVQFRPWAASVVQVYNTHACASPNVRRAPASIGGNVTNFVQQVAEDSGINVRHSVAPATILTPPVSLYQYDFDTYIMPNLTGNITLAGDGYDGQRVTFKKLGAAAANLLCAKQIDGFSTFPMTAAYSAVTIMFSAELDTWLVLSKIKPVVI